MVGKTDDIWLSSSHLFGSGGGRIIINNNNNSSSSHSNDYDNRVVSAPRGTGESLFGWRRRCRRRQRRGRKVEEKKREPSKKRNKWWNGCVDLCSGVTTPLLSIAEYSAVARWRCTGAGGGAKGRWRNVRAGGGNDTRQPRTLLSLPL